MEGSGDCGTVAIEENCASKSSRLVIIKINIVPVVHEK